MKHFKWIALSLALIITPPAQAQDYPGRVVTMIVPFSAGGPADALARVLAQSMTDNLKQQVIVENATGAGGTLGAARVSRADPDGYTILFASASHSFAPAVYAKLPYSQDDFAPIAIVNITPLMITVNPTVVPSRDLKSFIALLKANPGKYNYASSGVGTTLHIGA